MPTPLRDCVSLCAVCAVCVPALSGSTGLLLPLSRRRPALLKHLEQQHKQVYAVIGANPSKVYQVTPEQRRELLAAALAEEAGGARGRGREPIAEQKRRG